jgi:hypothetical protein
MVGSVDRANSGCLGVAFIRRPDSGCRARSSPETRSDDLSKRSLDGGAPVDSWSAASPLLREEDCSWGCDDDWCRAAGGPEAAGPGVVASRRNQDGGNVLELRKIKLQWNLAASTNKHKGAAWQEHSRPRVGFGLYELEFAGSTTVAVRLSHRHGTLVWFLAGLGNEVISGNRARRAVGGLSGVLAVFRLVRYISRCGRHRRRVGVASHRFRPQTSGHVS